MNVKCIMQFIIDHPEFISAAAALLSLIFALIVYVRTRMLLKPMERPMFCVIQQSAEANDVDEPLAGIRIIMKSKVKNIGKHTADNLDVWAVIIPDLGLKKTEKIKPAFFSILT